MKWLAASSVVMPVSASSLGSRSYRVREARSERPRASGEAGELASVCRQRYFAPGELILGDGDHDPFLRGGLPLNPFALSSGEEAIPVSRRRDKASGAHAPDPIGTSRLAPPRSLWERAAVV